MFEIDLNSVVVGAALVLFLWSLRSPSEGTELPVGLVALGFLVSLGWTTVALIDGQPFLGILLITALFGRITWLAYRKQRQHSGGE